MSKVMVVEDDASLREIYSIRITAEGYEVVSAGDGEEALAVAVREKPDLILSDVMMPKISGFDMLDILRSTPETANIKVIMMTALSAEDQRQRGERLGADRYLVKSQVGIEDVVAAIHEVIGDRAPAAPAGAEAPATPGAPTTTETPVAPAASAETPVAPAAPEAPAAPVVPMPEAPAAEVPATEAPAPVAPEAPAAPAPEITEAPATETPAVATEAVDPAIAAAFAEAPAQTEVAAPAEAPVADNTASFSGLASAPATPAAPADAAPQENDGGAPAQ